MINAYKILIIKPEGKRQLGRPRHRKEGNNKMNFIEIQCDDVDCIHLAHDRDNWKALVNMVINLCVPQEPGTFLIS
jgi:hypothetical protein